jgi:hypothetical protein
LPGDLSDQIEVLIQVQDDEARQLRGGGDDQVRHRGATMLAAVGKEHLNFDGAVFDGRSLVLDRHRH